MNFRLSIGGIITAVGASIDKFLLNNAIDNGDEELLEGLITKGVNVEVEDKDGRRAIHRACEKGYTSIVRRLLNHHCMAEPRDKRGQTPLHILCVRGDLTTIKLLLAHGCELEPRDDNHHTPMELANRFGNRSCAIHISQAIEIRNRDLFPQLSHTMSQENIKESIFKNCKSKLKGIFTWSSKSKATVKNFPALNSEDDRTICPICMVNDRNCSFDCGHTFCLNCGKKVSRCPMCRAAPTNPRKIII